MAKLAIPTIFCDPGTCLMIANLSMARARSRGHKRTGLPDRTGPTCTLCRNGYDFCSLARCFCYFVYDIGNESFRAGSGSRVRRVAPVRFNIRAELPSSHFCRARRSSRSSEKASYLPAFLARAWRAQRTSTSAECNRLRRAATVSLLGEARARCGAPWRRRGGARYGPAGSDARLSAARPRFSKPLRAASPTWIAKEQSAAFAPGLLGYAPKHASRRATPLVLGMLTLWQVTAMSINIALWMLLSALSLSSWLSSLLLSACCWCCRGCCFCCFCRRDKWVERRRLPRALEVAAGRWPEPRDPTPKRANARPLVYTWRAGAFAR